MLDIIHLLTAEPSYPPSLDSMVDCYFQKRKFDFEQLAWYAHYVDPERARALIGLYEALPEQFRLHFLLSPAVYETVHRSDKAASAAIDDLIHLSRSELAFANGAPADGQADESEIWTAMGDAVLRRSPEGWRREGAPMLDSLIVVDFESPQVRVMRPESPVMFRPAEDMVEAEQSAVIDKLSAAMDYIDRVAPTFGRLIRNYTRAIRVRKCERLGGFSSEHVTNTIGEIRVLNIHLSNYGVAKCAETLVHESVHNVLSTYEYLNHQLVFSGASKQFRPLSPWSGNAIPVASFTHAAFVWFALFHFAQRELAQPGVTYEQRADIMRRRNYYAAGFIIPTPLSHCLKDLAVFSRETLPSIDALQQIVRSAVHGEISLSAKQAAA